MEINNYDSVKSVISDKTNALSNFKKYENMIAISQQISDNSNMICVVNAMESELKALIASGRITEGDRMHQILDGYLNKQCEIKIKNDKSIQDTIYFYTNYKEFIDIKDNLNKK